MTKLTLDYLTVSIRPEKYCEGSTVEMLQNLVCEIFHLDGYLDKFQLVGRARHYIAVYRYIMISRSRFVMKTDCLLRVYA